MSDYADLLGLTPQKKKSSLESILSPKTPSKKITSSDTLLSPQKTPSHTPLDTPRRTLTQKRKILQTTDKWRWKPFINNARDDGTLLFHWVRDNEDDDEVEMSYPFEVLNKKCKVFQYNDRDYSEIIEPLHKDQNWSREETDFLFSLCQTFDLRFAVIHDRFTSDTSGICNVNRSMEDLKRRYYDIAQALLKSRAKDIPSSKLKQHPIMSVDYEYDYEVKRKHVLDTLFTRSLTTEKRENELREQLKKIESLKKRREEDEQREIKQKQKEEKEKIRREQAELEKQKKRNEKLRLAATPTVLTIDEEESTKDEDLSMNKFDNNIFSTLQPGVYVRSQLMTNYDEKDAHSILLAELGFDTSALMSTRRVHEAFETLKPLLDRYIQLQGGPAKFLPPLSDEMLDDGLESTAATSEDNKKKRKKQTTLGASSETNQKKKKKK